MDRIKRLLVKLGSSIVMDRDHGFRHEPLQPFAKDIADLHSQGKEIILVSSGAIGLGIKIVGHSGNADQLSEKQALAAIGQAALINEYAKLFEPFGVKVAQVLITADDLAHRQRYLNLRESLTELLKLNVIPILNENDSTSTLELEATTDKGFGDNDTLASLVSAKLDVDLQVILSTVDGLFAKPPEDSSEQEIIKQISSLEDFDKITPGQVSEWGRGGVVSKIEATKMASICGVYSIIANGNEPNVIDKIISDPEPPGTHIFPIGHLSAKKKWIGFGQGYQGDIIINKGATEALVNSQASLLPVGVVKSVGEFESGQVVRVFDESNFEIGRGLTQFSSDEMAGFLSGSTKKEDLPEEVIHRDQLVIFREHDGERS